MNTLFVGIDIGSESHHVCMIYNNQIERKKIKHSLKELGEFIEQLKQMAAERIIVGLEGSGGYAAPLDRMLLAAGIELLPIQSNRLHQYRQLIGQPRKDDRYDAELIARYLQDLNGKTLQPLGQSPLGNLRIFTRQRRTTKRELTQALQRMKKHVLEYFPDFLLLFPDLKREIPRAILKKFPSVSKLKKAPVSSIAKIKLTHRRVGPKAAQKVKNLVKTINFNDPLEKSMASVTRICLQQIDELLVKIAAFEQEIAALSAHSVPIQAVVQQITGAGLHSAAELLAEIGDSKRFATRDKLTLYCGIGALNFSSGKMEGARKATQVNHRTKGIICLIANAAVLHDEKSKNYYHKKRAEGKSHWHAIKCLSKYILRKIFKILKNLESEQKLAA